MILSIDMLTTQTSLSVGDVYKTYPVSRDQAELLIGQIEACLSEAGGNWQSLTAIVVLTGPGSFTGLRVGLASAHGMAKALDIPLLGVSAMKAFSILLPQNTAQWVLIDTRRKDVAMAYRAEGEKAFEKLQEIDVETAQKMIEKNRAPLTGNGINMLAEAKCEIALEWIDLLALQAKLQPEISGLPTGYHAIECEPIYLRAPDVTISVEKFEHKALYSA